MISIWDRIQNEEAGTTTFVTVCPSYPNPVGAFNCRKTEEITVKTADLRAYLNASQGDPKRHIQNAFPYLTPDQRERLQSGTCPPCWERMWPNG